MRLIVESPAPDLNESLAYYNSLSFRCSTWKKNGLCQTKNLTIFLNTSAYSRPCINLYEAKGFKGILEPEVSWCSLKNVNGDTISLLKANNCPHLFTNPSLAFFNGHQNSKIITHLKALNVPIKQEVIFGEEIIVDNLVINDPGDWGFLFLTTKISLKKVGHSLKYLVIFTENIFNYE